VLSVSTHPEVKEFEQRPSLEANSIIAAVGLKVEYHRQRQFFGLSITL